MIMATALPAQGGLTASRAIGPVKRTREDGRQAPPTEGQDGDQLAGGAADEADQAGDQQQDDDHEVEEGQGRGLRLIMSSDRPQYARQLLPDG
jgi:hypothetical protein